VVFGASLELAIATGHDRLAFLDGFSDVWNARLPLVVNDRDNAIDKLDIGESGR
jgi:hypothetical protein